jgi:hypothetical protein
MCVFSSSIWAQRVITYGLLPHTCQVDKQLSDKTFTIPRCGAQETMCMKLSGTEVPITAKQKVICDKEMYQQIQQ